MTRKDYELLASTIRSEREIALAMHEEIGERALGFFAAKLANKLGVENERFDTPRFLAACDPRQ